MNPYVFTAELPYNLYLLSGASSAQDVGLTSRDEQLLGSPVPPSDWPVPVVPVARAFHWGRSEELAETASFQVPLVDLKNTARSPGAMWAVEQFDIARDAYRRGLAGEAFDYLQRALRGDAEHGGHELDFRTHFLVGLLRLGSFRLHDIAIFDLAAAEQAFVTAGRYALCDFPADAAHASFAAGWCAYCAGRMDDAMRHTQQALALSPKFAAAHFQLAKIAFHRREPVAARPFLVQAISLAHVYAAEALGDGDFTPYAEIVRDVITQERDTLGRSASRALKDLTALMTALNLDPSGAAKTAQGETPVPDDGTAGILTFVQAARAAFRENTLHGYLRAEAAAAVATQAAGALRARIAHEQHAAQEAIATARQELDKVAGLQIGPYRLSSSALRKIEETGDALREAEAILQRQTLAAYLDARVRAQRVLTALKQTLTAYRDSALQQAADEADALERRIAQLRQRAEGGSTKVYACVGAIVAAFPGCFLGFFSDSSSGVPNWPALVLRGIVFITGFGLIGAVVGGLLAPMLQPGAPAADHALETRRNELKETISSLRALTKST